MNRLFRFALMAALMAWITACGNKGPLVMPQRPVSVDETALPEPTPANAAAVEEAIGNPADEPMNEDE
ncbi:MAG: lipoprotein [Xanthomonadaceae bacterium]|jgi:predicted small lipoprotein YifL|nr:lipoprotein [Xanthomonadaceae bacterium]